MNRISPVVFLICFHAGFVFSQTLPPPIRPIAEVISDYGPRNNPDPNTGVFNYYFHQGIYYRAPDWTPVYPVEDGTIIYINSSVDDNAAGWRIRTKGSVNLSV